MSIADDRPAEPTDIPSESAEPTELSSEPSPAPESDAATEDSAGAVKKKTTKKRRTKKKTTKKTASRTAADTDPDADESPDTDDSAAAPEPKTKKKVSRRSKKAAEPTPETEPSAEAEAAPSVSAEGEPASEPAGEPVGEASEPGTAEGDGSSEEASEAAPAKKKRSSRSRSGRSSKKADAESKDSAEARPTTRMLISYQPGEECRVAVTEDGKLEEFDAESFTNQSRVGNIYLGTVTNVEPGIQAAFVDFGVEDAGFLHVSDLHPMYFPGNDEDDTERVGKKTPRRERPPIQQALKRGQQVIVQVIKEGIGTKGPTVTSYLSIPGRFLVMMPNMDKVGVSRKVEDEDQRRKMRQILDQLELPEGFGFILRTAGLDRTKTEIKRDLAYLQRLWKAIEKARTSGSGKRRLLYAESDLLVRSLRDQLTAEFDEVIIDHPLALDRASRFMKIVAPRSTVKLTRYKGGSPMFHAFGVEEQIRLMHAREVPMPSGGRLVIDETEALVAIDVNSGKMRAARDAETNAYRVNLEAVDEICRQLRLRDLGGLVVNDLIDMRELKHRRAIEQRFKDRLKRDRARTTTLAISQFGILEMTRQRMRGSQQSQHFSTCPSCSGRGLLKRPATVAAEALRDLQSVLDHDRVAKVEIVVSTRLAGTLLSERRSSLGRIERASGKQVIVRVSEATPPDRVVFYAYDAQGSDIDLTKVSARKVSKKDLETWDLHAAGDEPFASDAAADLVEQTERERAELDAEDERAAMEQEPHPIEDASADDAVPDEDGGGKKKRRRRRRRGKRSGEGDGTDGAGSGTETDAAESAESDASGDAETVEAPAEAAGSETEPGEGDEGGKKKRRRRRRGRRKGSGDAESASGDEPTSSDAATDGSADNQKGDTGDRESGAGDEADQEAGKEGGSSRRRRGGRSRRGKGGGKSESSGPVDTAGSSPPAEPTPSPTVKKKTVRTLYGGSRRTLSASERGKIKFD